MLCYLTLPNISSYVICGKYVISYEKYNKLERYNKLCNIKTIVSKLCNKLRVQLLDTAKLIKII